MRSFNICKFIKLDSFNLEIPYSKTRAEILECFCKNKIAVDFQNDMCVKVKSTLLSLDIVFSVSFEFSADKLVAISFSPVISLYGNFLLERYKTIQKALENDLGVSKNIVMRIINFLDPKSSSCLWRKKGVEIEHYIVDRFGMEEIIDVKLYQNMK